MIRYYAREKRRLVPIDELEPGCWVNLTPPFTTEELEEFGRQFSIDPAFLTDSLDPEERARYERDEDVRFILINTPVGNKQQVESEGTEPIYITVPIGIILTIEHVITISAMETPVLELFIENRVRNFDPGDEKRFVLQILEQNVYRYLSSLKKLNMRRHRIERELLNSSRNRELKQLLSIEKSLVYFVNSLNGNELLKREYFSVGGGFVAEAHELQTPEQVSPAPDAEVPYPFTSCVSLLAQCKEHGLSISELVSQNELQSRSQTEPTAGLPVPPCLHHYRP